MSVVVTIGPEDLKRLNEVEKLADLIEIRPDLIPNSTNLKFSKPTITPDDIPTYHNYECTPDLDAVYAKMPQHLHCKIATRADTVKELHRAIDFLMRHDNVSVMCMGKYGPASRLLAQIFGSKYIYTHMPGSKEKAPGQIAADFPRASRKTKVYGLIGDPIDQSPSYITHNAWFKCEGIDAIYIKFPVSPSELSDFLKFADLIDIQGLSVTAPLKRLITNAPINTMTRTQNGWSYANTDGIAALDLIDAKTLNVLGRGGTAAAIKKEALSRGRSLGPSYTINASSDPSIPADFSVHHGTKTGRLLFCAQATYQFSHWFPENVSIKNNVTHTHAYQFLKDASNDHSSRKNFADSNHSR